MTPDVTALARLQRLATALEAVASAAATARPEGLEACEDRLADALSDLPDAADLSHARRIDVTLHLSRIQLALQRCRRIGCALTELVTVSLAAQGVAPGYAPAGAAGQPPRLGRLEVRA